MKNIYLISGLAADERVYSKINFGQHNIIFIPWIAPVNNEAIEAYALRLSEKITAPNPIIIGVSFGGMMAIEIAKLINIEKIILISSAKNKNEIPFYFKLAGKLYLNKIITAKILAKSNLITNKFFSARTDEDKALVAAMIRDTDVRLLKWSIDKIIHLKNVYVHRNLTHIHGTADRILLFRFIAPDVVIKGGSHLMIVNRAKEVQEKILEALK
jgi:pimeloyl-ACP methyl ester carboxylesterase